MISHPAVDQWEQKPRGQSAGFLKVLPQAGAVHERQRLKTIQHSNHIYQGRLLCYHNSWFKLTAQGEYKYIVLWHSAVYLNPGQLDRRGFSLGA